MQLLSYQCQYGKWISLRLLHFITAMSMYSLIFQFNQRLPFNAKNPIGFVVAILFECILAGSLMVTVKCLVILEFGTFSMLFPMTKDIKYMLKAINYNTKKKKDRPKIANQFLQVVQFHSKLIKLSPSYTCIVHTKIEILNAPGSFLPFSDWLKRMRTFRKWFLESYCRGA